MKSKFFLIHATIVNPFLNFMPFFITDVFYENQTHIGNSLGHPLYFFIWTLSSCFGFFIYSKQIWDAYKIHYSITLHKILIGIIFAAIFIPYSNSYPAWINDGHVWLAIAGVVGFITEWIWISLHSILQYTKEWKFLLCIFLVCTFFIYYFGHVTSFAEILFSTLVNGYTWIWAKKKEESI